MVSNYAHIDSHENDSLELNPVTRMCLWLAVSTSSYYYWMFLPQSAAAARRELLAQVIEYFSAAADGTYGYRRSHADMTGESIERPPAPVRQACARKSRSRAGHARSGSPLKWTPERHRYRTSSSGTSLPVGPRWPNRSSPRRRTNACSAPPIPRNSARGTTSSPTSKGSTTPAIQRTATGGWRSTIERSSRQLLAVSPGIVGRSNESAVRNHCNSAIAGVTCSL